VECTIGAAEHDRLLQRVSSDDEDARQGEDAGRG
jgi:hypothetical protein